MIRGMILLIFFYPFWIYYRLFQKGGKRKTGETMTHEKTLKTNGSRPQFQRGLADRDRETPVNKKKTMNKQSPKPGPSSKPDKWIDIIIRLIDFF